MGLSDLGFMRKIIILAANGGLKGKKLAGVLEIPGLASGPSVPLRDE